ncbi:hypothetical protein DL770_000941 [Monosporascus sp. CRB-9-2]|nr:hypothetical protein DL770_000941 [Monosporascus sp. CRB-9-2]
MEPIPINPRQSRDSLKEASISPPPQRTGSSSSIHKSGHAISHRQSFAENLRGLPSSPRSQRHPSLTQSAIQDLVNHPPAPRPQNPRFAGRDWRDVAIGELVTGEEVTWVEMDTSVEDATMALVRNTSSNVVLVRENVTSTKPVATFDYKDLNAYIVVVVGLAHPPEDLVALYDDLAKKAQSRTSIPLRDIQPICMKESLITLQGDQHLAKAVEVFGSGIHHVCVTNQANDVVGILSSQQIIAINSDSPLAEALKLMNEEGLTSVAVVDNGFNVVGNISTKDVKLLTNATSLPLLESSCLHFISVILSEQGVEKGKDSFPVFHVNPYSTLAHTVAKLVATRSHRMWVVESASPSSSAPATPLLAPTVVVPNPPPIPQSPLAGNQFASPPSASLPGSHLSGRLIGVVTLTDILNLFAKTTGLNPTDPSEQRARRRRSSSSSVRPSIDSSRASIDIRR